METFPRRPYRHSNLPNALRAASRAILDEDGPDSVGLREAARRVGVSATAAYRHFTNKEDLLASVAAEGFRELAASMEAAATGPDPAGAATCGATCDMGQARVRNAVHDGAGGVLRVPDIPHL